MLLHIATRKTRLGYGPLPVKPICEGEPLPPP